MIVTAIISTVADAVISHVVDKETEQISDKARDILGRDPAKRALKAALKDAFTNLEKQHPQWVASNFDASFFAHEGAPILAQFLVMNGRPDASELAKRWADSLNIRDSQQRTHYISELEPIAADFLHDLAQQLKKKEALRELNGSRALDQMAENIQAMRQLLEANQATRGTRQDYLNWLIDRNLYLDPRGTFQTQRQVQLKLDTIYISLQAQPGENLYSSDKHHPFEEELADLEMEMSVSAFTAEEREDKRDLLQHRFESRTSQSKAGEILELTDVVTRYDRVVILGDPGSGKTTLLRYLALYHAQLQRDGQTEIKGEPDKRYFPLLLRIAEYAENGIWKQQALSDFLPYCCTTHDCPKRGLADLLQNELEKGACMVMLDGLDEIVNADERFGVVKQIEDFVRRYSHRDNRFIITSRIAGYSSAPLSGPFKHYVVRDMNDTQIRLFLERWCQAVENAQTPEVSMQERERVAQREVDGIMQAIQNPGVHRLAVNPLLLRILALIHRTGAKLPQKRIELYKLASDTLARTWRPAQGVAEARLYEESALLKEEYLTPLLSELAYWLHTNKPTGVATEREVYEVLGEAWAHMNELPWDPDNPQPQVQREIRKFLSAVHTHTGLFVERAPKRYGFLHLTFEEYYVARYIVTSSRKRARLIRKHLHQPRWEEPVLLAIGFVGLDYPKEASELVEGAVLAQGVLAQEQNITPDPHEEILGQDYLFALRCLGDNILLRPGLRDQLLKRLANEYVNGSGLARFSRYMRALGEMLVQLADSESANTLVPILNTWLCNGQVDINVRSEAASALGELGSSSPAIGEALVAFLQDSQVDTTMRGAAASALAQLGSDSPAVNEALVAVLQDSQMDATVRRAAASALGRIGSSSPAVGEALVVALQDSQMDATVRGAAASALGHLGSDSPAVGEALVVALQNSQVDAQTRSSAAWVLGQVGSDSSAVGEALMAVLQDSQVDALVRSSAAFTMGQMGNSSPVVVEILVTFLQDSQANADARSSVAIALGHLGSDSPAINEALVAFLQDSQVNVTVRNFTAIGLGQLGNSSPAVVEALVVVLQNSQMDATMRSSAASLLGELGSSSPTIGEALVTVLQDSQMDATVRRSAASALGQLGNSSPAVGEALMAALQDNQMDATVRVSAAWALGQLGSSSPAVVETLVAVLQNNQVDALVRGSAASALKQLSQLKLLFSLEITSTLGNLFRAARNWGTKRDLAQLLGLANHVDETILNILWQGLRDDDNDVRKACAQALAQLGKKNRTFQPLIEKRLVEAIHDPNFEICDTVENRPAYDYAYEGLWLLLVGNEQAE